MKLPQFLRWATERVRALWSGPREAAAPAPRSAPAPAEPVAEPPRRPVAPSSVPSILLALVNRERGMRGIGRYDLDAQLTAVAEGHCDAMAGADRCDHAVGEERCLEDRVLGAGYAFDRVREAVAAGPDTALGVVREWFAEPGSRDVLLDPACRHAGFGLAVAADGRHYWTAITAAPHGAGDSCPASSVRLAPPVVTGGRP